MNVLCIYPPFEKTYWGAEYTMRLTGRKALLPPLGLLTVTALLPPSWQVRLCDMNVRPLADEEIDWADVVFLSGMIVQRAALRRVAQRCRSRGKRVVIGGPDASTSPDLLARDADCVVVGEAEDLIAPLAAALERGALPDRLEATQRPDVSRLPPPRWDLIDPRAYISMGVQWSRGCPFNCEFCDIIEIFGRKPRVKSAAQLCAELEALYRTGFRGSVFVVDDNFIGNKTEARRMLGPLAAWMRAHRDPFDLYTEASVNLAADEALIDAMVDAGFTAVFLGIETPAPEALDEAQKLQNTVVDLDEGVATLVRHGLEVMAGFILGFDADDGGAAGRLGDWIARSPIPLAMIGLLTALPGTQLERRLAREGRLFGLSAGDSFDRPNFVTRLDETELLCGYLELLERLYSPDAYFARAARALALSPRKRNRSRLPAGYALSCLLRSLYHQGLRSGYRRAYWRYLFGVARRAPRRLPRAVALAINGDHMFRFTTDDVRPRIRHALADIEVNSRRPVPPTRAQEIARPASAPIVPLAKLAPSATP